MMYSFGHVWEYVVLGVTSIFTEEAAPLIGGLRSYRGPLTFIVVGLSITAGTWSADILLYYLGRWRGDWVTERWPKVRALVSRVLRVVRRHPWRSSIAVRFAYGLRFTLPIACGAARIPLALYVAGSGISAISWSFTFTLVGWGMGETALRILGHVRRYEKWMILAIVVGLVIGFCAVRRRQVQVADEMVEVLASGDPDALTRTAERKVE
jgi:membrane protein DedA with SNARE-associated domain